MWEDRRPHPHLVHAVDWFPGLTGVDREIFIVMQRCDFGLDDLIRSVYDLRRSYLQRWTDSGSVAGWRMNGRISTLSEEQKLFQQKHRFSEREIRKFLSQILSALVFLNRLGIVHRDLKSENVLWARDSTGPIGRASSSMWSGNYKLCDFGIAAML